MKAVCAALALLSIGIGTAQTPQPPRRNVVLFIADGLRYGSVNKDDTPALWTVRTEGVNFENGHSVFPTFTTANASAIATGHQLGDTGNFSNTIWPGFASFDTGNFGLDAGTPVPFIENNRVLADLNDHFGGNYLGEASLLALARAQGYSTAAVGKVGPVGIQDLTAIGPANGAFPSFTESVLVDDATGSAAGLPVPPTLIADLQSAGLAFEPPTRSNGFGATSPYNNGYAGDRSKAGTRSANVIQQQWFADTTTTRVLPWLTRADKPFVLLYWSRDPDGTQHNQGDSLNALWPGINGETSRAAIRNADRNLRQILDWLDAHPSIKANTDVFVTSDHGLATVGRREIDRTGTISNSESAKHEYVDGGVIDTPVGSLPTGFLAIDLAFAMRTDLYDPDQRVEGGRSFRKLRVDAMASAWEHPRNGNGLISVTPPKLDASDARVIVAANGGSDLLYVPDGSTEVVQRLVELLTTFDYVGGLFVDDKYGRLPGYPAAERHQSGRRVENAQASHRSDLQSLLSERGEPSDGRPVVRYDTAGGAGNARRLRARTNVQQHGGVRAGLQDALQRPGSRRQCRHHADAAARHGTHPVGARVVEGTGPGRGPRRWGRRSRSAGSIRAVSRRKRPRDHPS